jgi:choline kinase
MAFTPSLIGSSTGAASTTANQASLALPTVTAAAGDLVVVFIACDNNQTTDGDEGAVTSVTDTGGNTYIKAREECNGQGGAQAGATVSVWYSVLTVALSSHTITANFSNTTSRDATAMGAIKATMAAGSTVSVAASNSAVTDAGGAPSVDAATGNYPHLRVRADGRESNGTSGTATTNWTRPFSALANTGTSATSMRCVAEYRVVTATGAASAPTSAASADSATVYVAFRENFALTPSLYTDDETFYAPTVTTTKDLSASLYTDTDTFYSPSAARELTPNLYTDTDTFYSATVAPGAVDLSPSLYTDADTFYDPAIVRYLEPNLFTDDDTFYSVDISRDLGVGLYTDDDTFYAAVIGRDLEASLYTDTDTFYSPTVNVDIFLDAPFYTDTDTFYDVSVSRSLDPDLYTDADEFYSAVISRNLDPSLYTDGDTFYSATVAPGAVDLAPNLYIDTDTFYAASASAENTLQPNLYTDDDAFYSATVSPGEITLSPSLYTDGDTFYEATTASVHELVAPLYTDDDTFYNPALIYDQVLDAALFTDGDVFYSPRAANIPAYDRGFEDTLVAFARQRRKDKEEREIRELLAWRAKAIAEAFKPFTR